MKTKRKLIRHISKTSIIIGLMAMIITIQECGGTTDVGKRPDQIKRESTERQKAEKSIESQYAEEAQEAIAAILAAAKVHYLETGRWVNDIEELPKLRLDQLTLERWNFVISSDSIMILSVQATSTRLMPGGFGKIVRFDNVNRSWNGYGIE